MVFVKIEAGVTVISRDVITAELAENGLEKEDLKEVKFVVTLDVTVNL